MRPLPTSRLLPTALLGALLLLASTEASASPPQQDPHTDLTGLPEDRPSDDPVDWALVPFLAGSTDTGIAFGLIGVLAGFDEAYSPYAWRLRARWLMSVRDGPDGVDFPEHNDGVQLDLPGRIGDRLRLTSEVAFQRWSTAGYFGIGNGTSVEPESVRKEAEQTPGAEPGRRYQHIRTEIWAQVNARIERGSGLAMMTGLQVRHVIPSFYGGSLLEEEALASADPEPGAPRLRGTKPHTLTQLSLGVLFDTRDNETDPTSGWFHEIALRVVPGAMTGHRMPFGGFTLNARGYLSLYERYLVLAGRAFVDLLFGTVPYHEMSSGGAFDRMHMPGGRQGIRGVPIGRYHGRIKLITNLELRSMFYEFTAFGEPFRVGAVAFVDAGRIWADYRDDPARDGNGPGIKWGVGAGPRLQWGETVLLRLDVSYSPDANAADPDVPVGVYAGLAHSF